MRGRYPSGPEYIDKLDGAAESKQRLKTILDTMYGQARLLEACEQLKIGETRIHQLREIALQAALDALEPGVAGRPSRTELSPADSVAALQQRVQQLEQALHEAQVREEIALILSPRQRGASNEGKKPSRAKVKIRKPR